MITGSGNVSVITIQDDVDKVQNLATVKSSTLDTCCGDCGGITTPPIDPTPARHNDLEEIQGGDLTNRWHVKKNIYDALNAATDASADNRFATVNDLSNNEFEDPSEDNPFLTLLEVPNPTEVDPTVPSWVKAITQQDIINWNAAYENVPEFIVVTATGGVIEV